MASKRRSSARRTSASVPLSSLTAVAMALSLRSAHTAVRSHAGQNGSRLGPAARRDDVLAKHLDGGERPVVGNGLGLGDENDLVDAGLLVEPQPLDAAVGIASDDDAAVAERS